MKRRISADSMTHEFRLLRNRVEAEVQSPALLLVTSATDADGAGFAAHGIVESLSRTHQRTVLVTSDAFLVPIADAAAVTQLQRRASDRTPMAERPLQAGAYSVVCLSPERSATISRTRAAEMVKELRDANDYVVVDAGNLAKNGLGMLLVGSADVAIVAFRAGRAQHDADKDMLDTLARAESKVLGVIMTDNDTIDRFAQREAHAVEAGRLDAPAPSPTIRRPAMLRNLEAALGRLVRSS